MINDSNKSLRPFYLYLLIGLTIITIADYAIRLGFLNLQEHLTSGSNFNLLNGIINAYLKFIVSELYEPLQLAVRLATLFYIWQFWLISPKLRGNEEEWQKKKLYHIFILLIGAGSYALGFYGTSHLNLFLIPTGYILTHNSLVFLTRKKSNVSIDKHPLDTLPSGKPNEFSLRLKTDKGELIIFNPFAGIMIIGQPGSGKSFFMLNQIQFQCLLRGYAAYIYDYKGNPPTLGKEIWQSVYHLNAKGIKTPKFRMFNPCQPLYSVRINPLDPKFIKTKFDAGTLADVLLRNLDKEGSKKKDFWAMNAKNVIQNIIWTNAQYKPEWSTIPHLIALVLRPFDKLGNYLAHLNDDIDMDMTALISALKNEAESQISGVEATTALPIAILNTEEIHYLLSENEMSLDISNPEDPTIFVAGTDPKNDAALAPILGLISNVVMNNINQQNKLPCLFEVDELPTQYINNLGNLPATARSNKVITCLTVQTRQQLIETYGKEAALVIWQNLGNQFYLVNKDEEASKALNVIGGKYNKLKIGSTTQLNEGSSSINENTEKEDIIPIADIMQQPTGHSYGILSDCVGSPLFGTQIHGNTTNKLLGISESDEVPLPRHYKDHVTEEDLKKVMKATKLKITTEVQEYVDNLEQVLI
ncbi:MAG: type IV secretory system conjugative DNA transfer family protein [Reichenbachiella sp.]